MREIKFRAWEKVSEKMVDLYAITPLALDVKLDQDGLFIPFSKDYILMQYTGLKDKNGVEIYEGDILIDDEYPDEGISYATIEAEGCGFVANPWFTIAELNENADDYEVIGNIYENPELLEKETK